MCDMYWERGILKELHSERQRFDAATIAEWNACEQGIFFIPQNPLTSLFNIWKNGTVLAAGMHFQVQMAMMSWTLRDTLVGPRQSQELESPSHLGQLLSQTGIFVF